MSDTLEYIESYFQQTLNSEERSAFEARCETDENFAKEVAFYIATRQTIREELIQQKEGYWKKDEPELEETIPFIPSAKKVTFARLITYAAAACLILAASVYFFESTNSPKKLAYNYINTNYSQLSHTMDGTKDSMQNGITAYNNKQYDKALQLFRGVEKVDPSNNDAKKFAGLTYLQQEDYDKALEQFTTLANTKGLFSNAGDFFKAVTLLERNRPGDKEEAHKLLQKVVNENEEGSNEANEWLKKF